MGDAHRRVGGVDRLPARAGRPEDVDLEISRVDVDLDLVGLGQDDHRRRRGVDPPLGLGHRHPLDPVGPALVLEPCQASSPSHHERDLVQAVPVGRARRQHLEPPPSLLGVTGVHLEEVLGEEVGLLAPFGTPDLHDHVAAGVRILGHEQQAELLFVPGDLGFGLGPPRSAPAHARRRWHRGASRGPPRDSPRPPAAPCQPSMTSFELAVAARRRRAGGAGRPRRSGRRAPRAPPRTPARARSRRSWTRGWNTRQG